MGSAIEFSKKATDMKIAEQNFLQPKIGRKKAQKRAKKRAKTRTKKYTKTAGTQHDFRLKKAPQNASGLGALVRPLILSYVATVWLLHVQYIGCRPALLHWAVQVGRLSGSVFLSSSFSQIVRNAVRRAACDSRTNGLRRRLHPPRPAGLADGKRHFGAKTCQKGV